MKRANWSVAIPPAGRTVELFSAPVGEEGKMHAYEGEEEEAEIQEVDGENVSFSIFSVLCASSFYHSLFPPGFNVEREREQEY